MISGTLLIDQSKQIDNTTNPTLFGDTSKLDNSGTETEPLGTFTLSADSTIDFGGGDWPLFFADLRASLGMRMRPSQA